MLRTIGLMSGTSLDGVDAAWLTSAARIVDGVLRKLVRLGARRPTMQPPVDPADHGARSADGLARNRPGYADGLTGGGPGYADDLADGGARRASDPPRQGALLVAACGVGRTPLRGLCLPARSVGASAG